MNASFQRGAALVVSTFLFVGCSGDAGRGLPKSPVSGIVKYKQELPEGQITFQHATGEMTTVKFGADGKYTQVIPRGPNKVIVVSASSSLTDTKPGKVRSMEVFTSRIPTKYNNFATSGLEYVVTDGENTFDINLVD